jgi:catechol 2,3-dioxygenase-like lactoylglutathione lyase family enzyme
VAFLATSNSDRARTFYQSTLGLRLVGDDPFALVFDANGVMIRIQKVETVAPVPYTALGWHVADVAATIQRLAANGVILERYTWLEQDDVGVWRSPSGAKVAWFKDPDGNVLAVTQS